MTHIESLIAELRAAADYEKSPLYDRAADALLAAIAPASPIARISIAGERVVADLYKPLPDGGYDVYLAAPAPASAAKKLTDPPEDPALADIPEYQAAKVYADRIGMRDGDMDGATASDLWCLLVNSFMRGWTDALAAAPQPASAAPAGWLEAARDWIEEAVGYVNDPAMSPSLQREGMRLLRRFPAAPQPASAAPTGWRLVPVEPTQEVIDSMALRRRHDFGLLDESTKEMLRSEARQAYEEVVGDGFAAAPQPPAADLLPCKCRQCFVRCDDCPEPNTLPPAADLHAQIAQAKSDVEQWPQHMRDTARVASATIGVPVKPPAAERLSDAAIDALMPHGEAEVTWFDPASRFGPETAGKTIDASLAFMDSAPIGTRLYSREQVRAIVRAAIGSDA